MALGRFIKRLSSWQDTDNPYLIVGLGNPEPRFSGTRHNAGFLAVDKMHQANGGATWKSAHGALISRLKIKGKNVMLAKPQKYMNNSGEVIKDLLDYYKIPLESLIVIYDDADLDAGRLRIRKAGGPGTHNGMRSIVSYIGEDFARVRIGIGKPEKGDLADYVLAKPEDMDEFNRVTAKAADAVTEILESGIDKAMGAFNV
ncbi:MAG TPA: aminoacyl-tRNA hydrolase [Clostridia bacterium]|nr:aminoacyl-tRNA hydrolase [Clostridia bacterium]